MSLRRPLLPFSLTAGILLVDQLSKALVVENVPRGTVAYRGLGDFFWLVHQRNPGIAFSLGDGLAPAFRSVLFILVPLCLVVGLLLYYFKSDEPTLFQRWTLAGIIGGGLGNLIDRIARPSGVVDFLSFKFYGLFGLERWPTFNVADASVVVSALLLVLSLLFSSDRQR